MCWRLFWGCGRRLSRGRLPSFLVSGGVLRVVFRAFVPVLSSLSGLRCRGLLLRRSVARSFGRPFRSLGWSSSSSSSSSPSLRLRSLPLSALPLVALGFGFVGVAPRRWSLRRWRSRPSAFGLRCSCGRFRLVGSRSLVLGVRCSAGVARGGASRPFGLFAEQNPPKTKK